MGTAERYSAQNSELNSNNRNLNEKNLKLRDECNVFRAREEEMRTLVNIQSSILSPEKCKQDLDGVVRKANSPMPTAKAPEPVKEETEEEESEEVKCVKEESENE